MSRSTQTTCIRQTGGHLGDDHSEQTDQKEQRTTRQDTTSTPTVSTWGQRGVPRAKRNRVLQRDGHECQLRYIGCTGCAAEVDDIVPVSVSGISRADATDDMLQAVCHSCHKQKTDRERRTAHTASTAHRVARKRLPQRQHPGD